VNPYRDGADVGNLCPRCELALTPRQVADVTIDECQRCGGVFVPGALIPRFLDGLDLGGEVMATFPPGTPVNDDRGPLYVKCPKCSTHMHRRLFAKRAKVILDICRHHGMWFDEYELRAIAVFGSRGGVPDMDEVRRAKQPVASELPLEQVEKERTSLLGKVLGFVLDVLDDS
jgi:Zn-finger nucleic acid-binding protein